MRPLARLGEGVYLVCCCRIGSLKEAEHGQEYRKGFRFQVARQTLPDPSKPTANTYSFNFTDTGIGTLFIE